METLCSSCLKKKATFACGLCQLDLCKNCSHFTDPEDYSFLSALPEELSASPTCHTCYDNRVVPQIAAYEDIFERAKNVFIFMKDQGGKATRLYSRTEPAVKIATCDDHDETILRLAFLAAEKGYNALVDVEIESEKVRNHAYQTLNWSGHGIPTQVDEAKIAREEKRRPPQLK